ncbi:MAG: nuclear transport factor 2 family protein [Anaerolineales bacterium]|nr:nuclear transport factor 2 family protein [Anaerolineales bacterium]
MSTTQADIATLSALNKRFIHNFVTNDVPSHSAILHPSFRTIDTMGGHMDRAAYLEEWATGFDPDVITYWDMRDERITLIGDVALVSAATKWTRVRDGVETQGMTCYTDTYIRTGETWLCVLAQLTSVAPQNYPPDNTIVVKYLRGVLQ